MGAAQFNGEQSGLMMPRITPRLDRQRTTAGMSTPVGARTSDVCPSWPAADAMASARVERDRVDVPQFVTTSRRIAKGAAYAPSQQSQWKIGAGAEGDDRSS
jgi:hypothetical protein